MKQNSSLQQKHCIPCRGGVPPMEAAAARSLLAKVPGWELIGEECKLRRSFTFGDFVQAQAFAVRVGELAEAEQHHPDICYGWGYCTVVFFTHKIGGLHENDFIMAARVSALAS